jgi:nitroreductase
VHDAKNGRHQAGTTRPSVAFPQARPIILLDPTACDENHGISAAGRSSCYQIEPINRRGEIMTNIQKTIRERHSTRGPFDPDRPVAKSDIKLILDAARWAPTAHNMQNFEILLVDDKERLDAIAQIPAEMSQAFLRENYEQLSFSKGELQIKKTGMLADMFPPAWINPEAWSSDSDFTSQLSFLGRSVGETQLLIIVLYDSRKRAPGSEGDFLGHMSLGCVMENMWLMSESLGVGFHVLTVFSDGHVETKVRNMLRIPKHMKIAFACALGHPVAAPDGYTRVRRDIEDFVHHNQFDHKDLVWSS